MSSSGPFDDESNDDFDFGDLFGGLGAGADPNALMANFMQIFSGVDASAGSGLDNAMNIAISIASSGQSETNVDPLDRMALEQLIRVAELQVGNATGLRTSTDGPLTIAPVTRGDWVRQSMQAYRPILEQLAAAMASPDLGDDPSGADPQLAMLEQLFASMRPMMINMTTGSMIGHIGSRAIGTYDLPIPRPGSNELLVVVPNLDSFGTEWSLSTEELRLWVVLSEVTHHSVLSIPHVAQRISQLLGSYTNAFRNDAGALAGALDDFEPAGDMTDLASLQSQLQNALGDPSSLIGSMRSPEQEAILPEINTLMSVIVGYIDHVMDSIGSNLISSYGQLTEALRRRRVTTAESDRFVERLLGLELDQALYDRGRAFIDGVVERAGEDGLAKLWESPETLPTTNELDAPGLWLSRVDIAFEIEIDPAELATLDALLEDPEEE